MDNKYIAVLNGKAVARIKIDNIVFVQRNKRKLRIVTDNETYDYYEKIDNVAPLLDGRFYPCLKGCYINLDKVANMKEQQITFDHGQVLYLGRENFLRTKQFYRVYLQNQLKQ